MGVVSEHGCDIEIEIRFCIIHHFILSICFLEQITASYVLFGQKNSYESPGIRFLSSSNNIDPLWRSVGHLGKVEVSCSEVLSQFVMLSGLEKFSLDSGDAENDENQEKMALLKRFFFFENMLYKGLLKNCGQKCPMFFQLLLFHFDPPGRAQLFRSYYFKSSF